MRIAVVIPTLNEEARLGQRLRELRGHQVVVVDGGSADRTCEVAREAGVRLVQGERGRGLQLNAGARALEGEVLLFLHADVVLPEQWVGWVRLALSCPGVVAGAFRTWTVDDLGTHPLRPLFHVADLRSRYSTRPYGDQALFVRRGDFEAVGGFPDQGLMEDVELSQRLAARGRIWTVPACVRVSGRRFAQAPLRSFAMMNSFPLLYRLGVSPGALERLYGAIR